MLHRTLYVLGVLIAFGALAFPNPAPVILLGLGVMLGGGAAQEAGR